MLNNKQQVTITLLFIAALLALYVHPVYDPDFWWHLRAGQWIWQHKQVPSADPFSFTTYEGLTGSQGDRVRYILTQYWLSQPVFYISWKWLGPAGVIFLRAGILLASVMAVFRFLLKRSVSFFLALSLSALAGLHLVVFTGERPQLFSFFFAAVYLYGLESLRQRQSGPDGNSPSTSEHRKGLPGLLPFFLPFLTLLWANMHSSALMAWPIGVLYLFDALLSSFRRPDGRKRLLPFIGVVIASLAVTFLNPNGFKVLPLLINLSHTRHIQMNTEFMSPIEQLAQMKIFHPAFWLLVLVSSVMLFSRKMTLLHRSLLLGLILLSLSAVRFTPFFVLLSAMLIGPGLREIAETNRKRLSYLLIAATLSIFISHMYAYKDELFTPAGQLDKDYPKAAVEFIRDKKIRGRMFNLFEWGGYLIWHLPEVKTFVDGRVLRLDVYDEYDHIMISPQSPPYWKEVFDKYRIDFVLTAGVRTNLIYLLVGDPQWSPVYADEVAIIFVKNPGGLEVLSGEMVLDTLIRSLRGLTEKNPDSPEALARLAGAYYHKKDNQNALLYYKKAFAANPDDPFLLNMIQLLEGRQ